VADALHFDYGPGRFGRRDGPPGLRLQELTQFSLASVIARRDQATQASMAAERACGIAPPVAVAIAAGNELAFIWSGPGHWLALGPQATEPVEARLGAVFGTHASVFDQSGSRVLLELRGQRVRDVLAKGMSIDLHPRSFRTGDVAVTTASHLAVHLWQVADDPAYRLLVVRTYFDSLWRWLAASAAEYGCEVLTPLPYTAQTT
jgi:sarcosine oxidase subunit gamma